MGASKQKDIEHQFKGLIRIYLYLAPYIFFDWLCKASTMHHVFIYILRKVVCVE